MEKELYNEILDNNWIAQSVIHQEENEVPVFQWQYIMCVCKEMGVYNGFSFC